MKPSSRSYCDGAHMALSLGRGDTAKRLMETRRLSSGLPLVAGERMDSWYRHHISLNLRRYRSARMSEL